MFVKILFLLVQIAQASTNTHYQDLITAPVVVQSGEMRTFEFKLDEHLVEKLKTYCGGVVVDGTVQNLYPAGTYVFEKRYQDVLGVSVSGLLIAGTGIDDYIRFPWARYFYNFEDPNGPGPDRFKDSRWGNFASGFYPQGCTEVPDNSKPKQFVCKFRVKYEAKRPPDQLVFDAKLQPLKINALKLIISDSRAE